MGLANGYACRHELKHKMLGRNLRMESSEWVSWKILMILTSLSSDVVFLTQLQEAALALAAWREVLRVLRGCRQLERSGWSVAWEALASAAGPTLLEILGRSAGGWPPSHHEGLEVSSFTLRMAGSARL